MRLKSSKYTSFLSFLQHRYSLFGVSMPYLCWQLSEVRWDWYLQVPPLDNYVVLGGGEITIKSYSQKETLGHRISILGAPEVYTPGKMCGWNASQSHSTNMNLGFAVPQGRYQNCKKETASYNCLPPWYIWGYWHILCPAVGKSCQGRGPRVNIWRKKCSTN